MLCAMGLCEHQAQGSRRVRALQSLGCLSSVDRDLFGAELGTAILHTAVVVVPDALGVSGSGKDWLQADTKLSSFVGNLTSLTNHSF